MKYISMSAILVLIISCGSPDENAPVESYTTSTFGGAGLQQSASASRSSKAKKSQSSAARTSSQNSNVGSSDEDYQKQQFICEIKNVTDSINNEVEIERDEVEEIYRSFEYGNVSEAQLERLTELLVKYRMFESRLRRETYYSPNRYDYPEIDRRTRDFAQNFIDANPEGPKKCWFTFESSNDQFNWQSYEISSSECRKELLKRIRPLPVGQVLSQAIVESSWGESRFAEIGNNLFGHQVRFNNINDLLSRPYCIQAENAPNRCVYKYLSYHDSIREHFRVFNAGPVQVYYRENREYNISKINSCEDASLFINGLVKYAENPDYITHINEKLNEACSLARECK